MLPPADLAAPLGAGAPTVAANAPSTAPAAPPEVPARLTVGDRLLALRDRLYRSARFQRLAARVPGARIIGRQRARALFDLCAGFVYSQTLAACVRLGLLELVADRPRTMTEIATELDLEPEAAERLLRAAAALGLVQPRSGGRIGLGPLGAPVLGAPGLAHMIEHHELLYDHLRDPVAALRGERGTPLAGYFSYAGTGSPERLGDQPVAPYTRLMAATVAPLASELLDAVPLGARRCIMDVGGGDGSFLEAVGRRHAGPELVLFDLPAVAARAEQRFAGAGFGARARAVGGNFHHDELPAGADTVTLVRVLLDHGDDVVLALLRKIRLALPAGGQLVIAEAFGGAPGAEAVGDAYFGWYLAAMGRGRARRPAELGAMLAEAGFRRWRMVPTRYPVYTGLIVAEV